MEESTMLFEECAFVDGAERLPKAVPIGDNSPKNKPDFDVFPSGNWNENECEACLPVGAASHYSTLNVRTRKARQATGRFVRPVSVAFSSGQERKT